VGFLGVFLGAFVGSDLAAEGGWRHEVCEHVVNAELLVPFGVGAQFELGFGSVVASVSVLLVVFAGVFSS
jgi:hypothetical protein